MQHCDKAPDREEREEGAKESKEIRGGEDTHLQGVGKGGTKRRTAREECKEGGKQLQLLGLDPCKERGSIEQREEEEEIARKRVRVDEESTFEAPQKLDPCKGMGSIEQCEEGEHLTRKRVLLEEDEGLKGGGCDGGEVGRGGGDGDADVDRNGGADEHGHVDGHGHADGNDCADMYGMLMEAWEKVGKRCCERQMCAPMLSTQLALGLGNRGMRESAGEEMKEVEEVEERVEREGRTASPGRVERASAWHEKPDGQNPGKESGKEQRKEDGKDEEKRYRMEPRNRAKGFGAAEMSDDHQREMREWGRELGALWEVRARESAAVGILLLKPQQVACNAH
ncbi:unnamed protein product [Closterium sp. Naga37s-1]|nr:unnamed protein product [Closterium sp. Naga37s-1]